MPLRLQIVCRPDSRRPFLSSVDRASDLEIGPEPLVHGATRKQAGFCRPADGDSRPVQYKIGTRHRKSRRPRLEIPTAKAESFFRI